MLKGIIIRIVKESKKRRGRRARGGKRGFPVKDKSRDWEMTNWALSCNPFCPGYGATYLSMLSIFPPNLNLFPIFTFSFFFLKNELFFSINWNIYKRKMNKKVVVWVASPVFWVYCNWWLWKGPAILILLLTHLSTPSLVLQICPFFLLGKKDSHLHNQHQFC